MDEKTIARFWSKVDKNGPVLRAELGACWVWIAYRDPDGYGNFWMDSSHHKAHRIAWECEHGEAPQECCLHRCDNPSCVRPSHLFSGTHADNIADKLYKGRAKLGMALSSSKLTDAEVLEIRRRYRPGVAGVRSPNSQSSLAAEFGVAQTLVSAIVRGKKRKHLCAALTPPPSQPPPADEPAKP